MFSMMQLDVFWATKKLGFKRLLYTNNNLSEKLSKQLNLQLHQKSKILRNKFNQRGEISVH